MISSDDAANAALSFFREWMNSDTKLGVNVTLGSFTATGSGAITSLEDDTLWIRDAASGFSIHVPLTGATFKSVDPERGMGESAFDELAQEFGFKFFWQIDLPGGIIVVLSDVDTSPPSVLL